MAVDFMVIPFPCRRAVHHVGLKPPRGGPLSVEVGPFMTQMASMALPTRPRSGKCPDVAGGPPRAADGGSILPASAPRRNLLEFSRRQENGQNYLLRVEIRSVEMAKTERHAHQVRNIACLHFLDDGSSVMFGSPRAYLQLVSDKLGRQSLQEQGEDFSLALGQQREPSLEFCHFLQSITSFVSARQC